MNIYMAGALFTAAEINFNTELASYLRGKGHNVFLPQESEAAQRASAGTLADPAGAIFESNRDAIDCCDVVLACIDGSDPDSGTSWEIGYGYASDKFIVCYRTDFRTWQGFDPVNLMLTECAHDTIYLPGADVLALALAIDGTLTDLAQDIEP